MKQDHNPRRKKSGLNQAHSQDRGNWNWEKKKKRMHGHFHKDHKWKNWDHSSGHWPQFTNQQRGLFFLRFFFAFALIIILFLGGVGTFLFLLSRFLDTTANITTLVWLFGCSLSLALPIMAIVVARMVFHGIATPISDIMTVTEAVGQGNFTARVPIPEHGPQDFRQLAESFNSMIDDLARLEEQRRNLTADVAHELRTPLHILQGNLEGILDGVYQPTSEQINAMLDETRVLTRLVEDLQTLSLADSGQLALEFEKVDVAELLYDIKTSFCGQMEAAKIDIQVRILEDKLAPNEDMPYDNPSLRINADPSRVYQIITNLVSNALRYTNEGGSITLSAQPTFNGIIVKVSDTGDGIPEKDLPYVFDRFWKGDRTRGQKTDSGSGLGLAICRKLVDAHGGQIQVESQVGKGTVFTMELPNNPS